MCVYLDYSPFNSSYDINSTGLSGLKTTGSVKGYKVRQQRDPCTHERPSQQDYTPTLLHQRYSYYLSIGTTDGTKPCGSSHVVLFDETTERGRDPVQEVFPSLTHRIVTFKIHRSLTIHLTKSLLFFLLIYCLLGNVERNHLSTYFPLPIFSSFPSSFLLSLTFSLSREGGTSLTRKLLHPQHRQIILRLLQTE